MKLMMGFNVPATFEVGLPEASRTGPSQVTSKKLLGKLVLELQKRVMKVKRIEDK